MYEPSHTVHMEGDNGPLLLTVHTPNPDKAVKAAPLMAVELRLSKRPPRVVAVSTMRFVRCCCDDCGAVIYWGEEPKQRGNKMRCRACKGG